MSVATDKRDTCWVLYRMLHEKRAYGVAVAVNVSEIEQVGAVNEGDSWWKGCEFNAYLIST